MERDIRLEELDELMKFYEDHGLKSNLISYKLLFVTISVLILL